MNDVDWGEIHAWVVEIFRAGWESPSPTAWDGFIDDRSEMVQPMLSDGIGARF